MVMQLVLFRMPRPVVAHLLEHPEVHLVVHPALRLMPGPVHIGGTLNGGKAQGCPSRATPTLDLVFYFYFSDELNNVLFFFLFRASNGVMCSSG